MRSWKKCFVVRLIFCISASPRYNNKISLSKTFLLFLRTFWVNEAKYFRDFSDFNTLNCFPRLGNSLNLVYAMILDIKIYQFSFVFTFFASQILLFVPYIQSDASSRENLLASPLLESMRQSLWFGFTNVACIAVCIPVR